MVIINKEKMNYIILDDILEQNKAKEMASSCGLSSEEDFAEKWFNEIESTGHIDNIPTYSRFVKKIEMGDLYYDYSANYYFIVNPNRFYAPYIPMEIYNKIVGL
jgi:hypothetical protein